MGGYVNLQLTLSRVLIYDLKYLIIPKKARLEIFNYSKKFDNIRKIVFQVTVIRYMHFKKKNSAVIQVWAILGLLRIPLI